MNRKRVAVTAAVLFLVQSITPSMGFSQGTFELNPPTKVSLTEPELSFKQAYATIHLALFIYKLDAIKRCSKAVIKEALHRDYEGGFFDFGGVRLDTDHINLGDKGGWTRYYLFSIGEKRFIVRIFRQEEKWLQPKVRVLYEDTLECSNLRLTFQILPGINDILKDCNIKPHKIHLNLETSRSP